MKFSAGPSLVKFLAVKSPAEGGAGAPSVRPGEQRLRPSGGSFNLAGLSGWALGGHLLHALLNIIPPGCCARGAK